MIVDSRRAAAALCDQRLHLVPPSAEPFNDAPRIVVCACGNEPATTPYCRESEPAEVGPQSGTDLVGQPRDLGGLCASWRRLLPLRRVSNNQDNLPQTVILLCPPVDLGTLPGPAKPQFFSLFQCPGTELNRRHEDFQSSGKRRGATRARKTCPLRMLGSAWTSPLAH